MLVEHTLPAGSSLRAATVADFDAIWELLVQREMATLGRVDILRGDMERQWTAPGFDLARDSLLAFDEGDRLAGYLRLHHEQYADFSPVVTPALGAAPEVGAYLLAIGEAWARERMAQAAPDLRVTLGGWTAVQDQERVDLYKCAGFEDIRHFYTMRIDLESAPLAPVWPAGIELRPYVLGRDDLAVFQAVDAFFADHWGHVSGRYEQWRHYALEREHLDPSLWFLAYAGEEIVGLSLCIDEGEYGWVDDLAVARRTRGQGLGMALLKHSFSEFYRRGQKTVKLGVDGQSLTGALRLYERAGMKREKENIVLEKELRAGRSISTQELTD